MFFSEEKNQMTFMFWRSGWIPAMAWIHPPAQN
jgi:hypothetical protein